jgi:hypothetical protein
MKHDDQQDRDRKLQALMLLAATVPKSGEMAELFPRFLDLSEGIPAVHYEAACRELAKIWDNHWDHPQPGEINKRARRLSGDAARKLVARREQAARDWSDMQSRAWWIRELRRILGGPIPSNEKLAGRRERRIRIAECMAGIAEFPSEEARERLLTRLHDYCYRNVSRGTYAPPIKQETR